MPSCDDQYWTTWSQFLKKKPHPFFNLWNLTIDTASHVLLYTLFSFDTSLCFFFAYYFVISPLINILHCFEGTQSVKLPSVNVITTQRKNEAGCSSLKRHGRIVWNTSRLISLFIKDRGFPNVSPQCDTLIKDSLLR